MQPERAIQVIERRMDFLYRKLTDREDDSGANYDRAELAALELAVVALKQQTGVVANST